MEQLVRARPLLATATVFFTYRIQTQIMVPLSFGIFFYIRFLSLERPLRVVRLDHTLHFRLSCVICLFDP